MSVAPTFSLPACPACSNRGVIARPVWKFARNTSERTGKPSYLFLGCKHAAETANPQVIYADPDDWKGVEADWAARTERLFAAKTANYSEVARVKFRRELVASAFLPGATELLNLSPQ